MSTASLSVHPGDIGVLLRGETNLIMTWTERWSARRMALHLMIVVLGSGLYGAAMGWWRDPWQALYTALKLPLIILLVTLGNALLNAMLAPLLGLNITFRQSLLAVLMSFAIASAILGSFSPLAAFVVWNLTPMVAGAALSGADYSAILVGHVTVIALAGLAANLRLFQLLVRLGGNGMVARRVLFAWLAGNLFLGSQLSWILRPFVGSPLMPVQFLRANAFHGNFYESVFSALKSLF